jgi:alanyl-tRNA synthetase
VLARRVFSIMARRGWELDFATLFEKVSEDQSLFPELKEAVDLAAEVMEEEKKKYEASRERGRRRLIAVVKKKGTLSAEDMKLLYESYGVTPEDAREFLSEEGLLVPVPDIYQLLEEPRKKGRRDRKAIEVGEFPPTELLYYKDPYLFELEAEVLGSVGNWVVLDRTAFYPEGGGQESDRGWLNGIRVLDVQKAGSVVLHRVEKNVFKKGDRVRGVVDAERRKALMRHHTATHIILAAARKVLGRHVWQEGAHKGEEKAHIDISHFRKISNEELVAIEREANRIVMENIPVRTYYMDRTEAEKRYGIVIYQGGAVPGRVLRIVEIQGVDMEACGGTHVRSTGEVGLIKIIRRVSVADGIERIEFAAGEKALEHVEKTEEIAKEAAKVLGCGVEELPKTASSVLEKVKKMEKELDRLREEVAELLSQKSFVVLRRSDPRLAQMIYRRRGGPVVVVALEGSPNVMLFGKAVELAGELKRMGAKGGGKGDRVFLTVSNLEAVVKWLAERLQKP